MPFEAAAVKDSVAKEENKAADLKPAENNEATEAIAMKEDATTLDSKEDYSCLCGVDDNVTRTTEPRALKL